MDLQANLGHHCLYYRVFALILVNIDPSCAISLPMYVDIPMRDNIHQFREITLLLYIYK